MNFHRQNTVVVGLMAMVATTSNASVLGAQALPADPVAEAPAPGPPPPAAGATSLNVTAAAGTVTNLTVPVGVTSIAITAPTPVASESPPTAEDVRGGALARIGIVAGVVMTGVVTAPSASPLELQPSPTAMPYVGFLPALWATSGAESRAYCSRALWLDGVADSAQETADAAARARARRVRVNDEQVTDAEVFESTGWNLREPAHCHPMQNVGFYVGVPIPYRGAVSFSSGWRTREVRSVFSAGLLVAMPPYLSLVAGYALMVSDDASEAHLAYTSAFTFGIGTSLDILDFLLSL